MNSGGHKQKPQRRGVELRRRRAKEDERARVLALAKAAEEERQVNFMSDVSDVGPPVPPKDRPMDGIRGSARLPRLVLGQGGTNKSTWNLLTCQYLRVTVRRPGA